jgi:NAD(P)H-hydrate repair Nnr-like enzyme with NAD(P)H-hydrate epimerase domain
LAPSEARAEGGGDDGGVDAVIAARRLKAAKDLVRDILAEEQRKRTQEIIDAAWQTLE